MHPPFYFILKINITLPLMGEGTNPNRTTLAGFEADAVRGVGERTRKRMQRSHVDVPWSLRNAPWSDLNADLVCR